MEKFDMADLRQLIELTEYLKEKYPDINVEITVSEASPEDESSPEQLRLRKEQILSELQTLKNAMAKCEEELDELEDSMPDPYLTEHIDWLLRCGDTEDRIDELTGCILSLKGELNDVLRKLLNCPGEK